jgi:hypothetical protein
MKHSLLIGLVVSTLAALALAEEPSASWEPIRQDQGITVSRLNGGAERPTFRGTVVLEAELLELLAVLNDDARRPEWMSRCLESRVLEERPDGSSVVYTLTEGSWPVSDRDAVTETRLDLDLERGRALIELRAIESDLMPPVRGTVRMPQMEGHYLLETVSPGRTRVEYQLSLELGGRVPGFVASFVEEEMPFDTLRALRKQVLETRGQYATKMETIRLRLPSVATPPPEGSGS